MQKLIVNNPDSVRLSIRLAAKGSRDQRLMHILHCVLLVGLGCSCHEVGEWFGDSGRTVERWVGAFNRYGVTGLCAHVPGGPRPRLSSTMIHRLVFELRQSPDVCGYAAAIWCGRLLIQHLREHYGVNMGLRQCQRILRRSREFRPPIKRT